LKKLIIFLALFLCGFNLPQAFAQLDQVLRLELVPPKDIEELLYDVTSLGEHGLLVSTQPKFQLTGDNKWTISRYDTLLNKLWEKTYTIDQNLSPTQIYLDSAYLYVLLTQPESVKIKIFRMDFLTGDYDMIEGSTLAYIDVSEFKVLGGTAYIGGLVKLRPVVVAFNFFDKRSRVLPALYEARSELCGIEVDYYRHIANIIVNNTVRNRTKLFIKSFDYSGRIIRNVPLQTTKEKSLQTAKVSDLNEKEQLVMGYYSLKASPYSQGIYMAKLNGDEQDFIKYFTFNDFTNFFSYMKPKRQERMKHRIVKLREKGKELQHRYRLLLHDVIETKDQYILVGEAYYPQYRSSSFYGYGSVGRGYNDRIFDGYRYTHAVVCGFDKTGNLLWDNSFEILDYNSFYLKEIVKVAVDDQKVILIYPEEGTVNTKVIKGNEVLKGKENYTIKTNFAGDKVTDAEDASVDHWYGKYFITWGMQEINNNKDSGVSNNRKVFYLNKINYSSEVSTLLDDQNQNK
jgi:hypothetical protein